MNSGLLCKYFFPPKKHFSFQKSFSIKDVFLFFCTKNYIVQKKLFEKKKKSSSFSPIFPIFLYNVINANYFHRNLYIKKKSSKQNKITKYEIKLNNYFSCFSTRDVCKTSPASLRLVNIYQKSYHYQKIILTKLKTQNATKYKSQIVSKFINFKCHKI